MLSRLLLLFAGLFTGLWIRGATGALSEIGLPALALLALILAVAAAPRAAPGESKARLEDAYRAWLDALYGVRAATAEPQDAAGPLRSATHAIMVSGTDRVIRALHTAAQEQYSARSVARVIIEMRRSIGRASVTVRPAELEALLGGAAPPAHTERGSASLWSEPASFLS